MPKPKRVYYYKNELTDDFAGNNIETKKIPADFKYVNNNIFFRVGGFLFYHIIARPLVWVVIRVTYSSRLKNKKVLKTVRNKPHFIYGNHTGDILDAFRPNTLQFFTRKNYIISSPDAFSIKGIRTLVAMLGALPICDGDLRNQKKLLDAVETRLSQNASITVFPEKHIWPYYTKIRPFEAGTLYYPVRFDAPVITLTTTYQKRRWPFRWIKRPRAVHYLDGPFYPDQSLSKIEARNKLRDEIYNTMVMRSNAVEQVEYCQYIKVEEGA